ncbi:MAG: tetratricopeptide repeat protein [Pseudoxanthomonas sp.]
MTLIRIFMAAMLAFYSFAAQAQSLPKPKEFYFDPDAGTTRKIVVVPGEGDAVAAELVKLRERGRKPLEATAQLAHVAMSDNRLELGKTLYAEALETTQTKASIGRTIRWNYAWDLYRQGEVVPALNLWAELAGGFGQPGWVPPTLALALWSADRKTEAVQWYAAAIRTEPNLWGNPANYPALLPEWRDEDRKLLAEVYAAWTANPPAWP